MTVLQYPICLNVQGRLCLIVGGGAVAARKAAELLRCGASLRVVSPALSGELADLLGSGQVEHLRRGFEPADVDEAFLVIAATDELSVNELVARSAFEKGTLINVVDQPELCGFTAPAVLRRGPLTVAVSTCGASPGLAGRVRDEIAAALPPQWEQVVEGLGDFRRLLGERLDCDAELRRAVLAQALSLDLLGLVREGGRERLDGRLRKLLEESLGLEVSR